MRERTSFEHELRNLGLRRDFESPVLLTDDQRSRAVRSNRRYAASLGWGAALGQIGVLLGVEIRSPDSDRLPDAIATWQRPQSLTVDGIIGPNTWSKLRGAIGPTPKQGTGGATTGPVGPFGTLALDRPGKPPFRYTFTPEDVLWTARFITGEAGGKDTPENQAVISTMFNRYTFFTHPHYPTFHAFIRAYSTPLQPVLKSWGASRRHMNNPDFVRTGGSHKPPHQNIPKGQLGRFLALQKRSWSSLPAGARALAERALRGALPNLIGNASEFGSTRVYYHDRHKRYPTSEQWREFTLAYARQKKWTWVGDIPGLNQQGNTFFIDNRVANFPPNAVRVLRSG